MLIFPAIDLKDGRVVRLYKGDFDTVHQVAEDPVETARQFRAAGARYLPMVDLARVLHPAGGADQAVPGVDAHGDPLRAEGLHRRTDQIRVADGAASAPTPTCAVWGRWGSTPPLWARRGTPGAEGLPRRTDQIRVADGGGADDRPPDPQPEHLLQIRHGPDAASAPPAGWRTRAWIIWPLPGAWRAWG